MNHFSIWTTKEASSILHDFRTQLSGLSSSEAQKRRAQYGNNIIDIHNPSIISIFTHQLQSPFNYLLIIAAILELYIGDYTNTWMIILLTSLNISIGFFQEHKARRAILLLRRYIPSTTTIIRDGKKVNIANDDIVPGDILVISPGTTIAADARIIDGTIIVDESTLTGEAEPIIKNSSPLTTAAQDIFQAYNILFAGTQATEGDACAVVIATGDRTVFHEITASDTSLLKLSAYEKNILSLSRIILRFVVITLIIIFIIKQLLQSPINISQETVFFITLIIAMVPEALPTVIAFSLARSALKLAKKQVIVKRLTAINDLGDIDILCTDKTGTITELQLSVDTIESPHQEKTVLFLLAELPNPTTRIISGNTVFDAVIYDWASQKIKDLLSFYTIIDRIPFDPTEMRTIMLIQDTEGQRYIVFKGAPEKLLSESINVEEELSKEIMQKKINDYGNQGKRTLGISYKKVDCYTIGPDANRNLTFLGFAVLNNPIKEGVNQTITIAKNLGVQVKMITGDCKEVATFVGMQTGLTSNSNDVITGPELRLLSAEEFKSECFKNTIFARIDPTMKARIVANLQESHEVGFMGEGMNDVPALKKANVAIVVQEASDVARSIADIILLKRDLLVVVTGIREGRTTFSNINKYIRCTLIGNFGNYYSLAFFSLIIPFLPMLPTQILLINLLSDLPLIAIASDTVEKRQLRCPKTYQLSKMLPLILLLGFVGTLSDFIFFAVFYTTPPNLFRSLWFLLNILSDAVLIYSIRTSGPLLQGIRPSNLMIATTIASIAFAFLLLYSPIGQQWFFFVKPCNIDIAKIFGIVCIYGFLTEFIKTQYTKYIVRNKKQ